MGDPDLSTLPGRMRYAAQVLREAEERRTPGSWPRSLWAGIDLEHEADVWEAEDRAAAERDAQVEELARDIGSVIYLLQSGEPRIEAMWRDQARALIESGWHKADV